MGGIPEVIAPKPSIEEIYARLIEIGRNAKVPAIHTIWVVEDPHNDRTTLDDICYSIPVGHLEMYPYGILHLTQHHIAFFPYQHKQAAIEEANRRLTSYRQ